MDPQELVKELDKHVIGQENIKQTLALALMNRSLRMLHKKGTIWLQQPLKKQNVLLIGPTGSGKTKTLDTIGEVVGCLITHCDMSGITSSGYHGASVDDLLKTHRTNASQFLQTMEPGFVESVASTKNVTLWHEADIKVKDIEEMGILHLDEFDKCRSSGKDNSVGRDVNGTAVQQEILKILEGKEFYFAPNSLKDSGQVPFQTENLLCVCTGAFVGLDDIISRRLNKAAGIGFNHVLNKSKLESDDILALVQTEDLIEYGFLPEVIGRLPLVGTLKELTSEQLQSILTEVKDSLIGEQQSLFKLFGITLEFEPEALEKICKLALEYKTGARALRSIVSKVMQQHQYRIYDIAPQSILTITKTMVGDVFK